RIEHRVGTVLGNLLDAAMQVSDDALKPKNLLTVEPQDDAQNAMGRRMLRPHIDDQLVRIEKRLLGSVEIKRRECFRIGHLGCWCCYVNLCVPCGERSHCPLSIPRLICTHSLSCCRIP